MGTVAVSRGLTLLEVLVSVAVLALVATFLATMRIESLRSERVQREHALLSNLLRSEAELLRLGSAAAGTCSALTSDLVDAGFSCEVRRTCGFSTAVCSDSVSLHAYVIHAATPGGASTELPLLFRTDSTSWIASQQ